MGFQTPHAESTTRILRTAALPVLESSGTSLFGTAPPVQSAGNIFETVGTSAHGSSSSGSSATVAASAPSSWKYFRKRLRKTEWGKRKKHLWSSRIASPGVIRHQFVWKRTA